jgi:hypothetical protein
MSCGDGKAASKGKLCGRFKEHIEGTMNHSTSNYLLGGE